MKRNLDDFSKAGRCDVSRALRFLPFLPKAGKNGKYL